MRYIQSLREREPDSPDHSEHGYLLVRMSTLYDMMSGNSYSMFIDEEESDAVYQYFEPEDEEVDVIPYTVTSWARDCLRHWKTEYAVLDAITSTFEIATDGIYETELRFREFAGRWGFIVPIEERYNGTYDVRYYNTKLVRLDEQGEMYGNEYSYQSQYNRHLKTWMSREELSTSGRPVWQQCHFCGCHSRARTNMIPVKYVTNFDGRAKSVCEKCIGLIAFVDEEYLSNLTHAHEWMGNIQHLRRLTAHTIGYNSENKHFYIIDRVMETSQLDTIPIDYTLYANPNTSAERNFNRKAKKIRDALARYELPDTGMLTHVYVLELPETWQGDASQFITRVQSYNYTPAIFLNGAYQEARSSNLYYSRHVPAIQNREDWTQTYGPFYGMEIEVKVRDDRQDWRTVQQVMEQAILLFHPYNYPKYFLQDGPTQLIVQKHDGSLHRQSTEYVTQPLSYDYWMNHIPDRFWDYFRNNFMGRTMENYGIHIHIGYDSMDIPHRWMFLELLDNMMIQPEGVLRAVAGRGSNGSYARWQPLVFQGARHRAFEVARQKQQTGDNSKYWAVNTRHPDTLELRMFQSNTGKNSILGMIQFVQNMWAFSKSLTEDVHWDYDDEDQAPPEMLLDRIQSIRQDADSRFMSWVMSSFNQDAYYLLRRLSQYDNVREQYQILVRE